jgi:ribose transport system substrate-binding protein
MWDEEMSRRQFVVRTGAAASGAVLSLGVIEFIAACGQSTATGTTGTTSSAAVTAAKKLVASSLKAGSTWVGPTSSAKPASGKKVALISIDRSSPGAQFFEKGVTDAASAMGWTATILDGQNQIIAQAAALGQAIALKPDGIILQSLDALTHIDKLKQATSLGIKVIGWHSAGDPGPHPDLELFTNINSSPLDIGQLLASYIIADSNGTGKAIILTDDIYAIAKAKAGDMQSTFSQCGGCQLLEYKQFPLSTATTEGPSTFVALYQRYGKSLQYMMAIADFLFDVGVPALRSGGVAPNAIKLVGSDGAPTAYARIRNGDYQVATVPEPLEMHAWQCMDEMVRALAGQQPSGFVTPVYLVTKANINEQGGDQNRYSPTNNYATHYKQLWGVA